MTDVPWPIRPLEDVVEILDRLRVPVNATERAERPGNVPYYGATGQVGTIDEPLFDEPLVLLGEDGVAFFDPLTTKAYLIDGPAWVNNHAHVLRPSRAVERRFLKHWLDVVDYREHANGTTRLKLTQGAMRKIPIPIPPLGEQHAIVETIERMLSQLDAATSEMQRGLRRLSVLRDALAHAAVSGRLLGLPRGGDGEWSTPPTWRWRNVSDVAEIRGGIQKTPDRRPVRNTAPFLRVANVQRDELELSDVHDVELEAGELDRYRLRQGDLLIVEGNGSLQHIGRSAVWDGSIADCVHQNHLIRVRPGVEITSDWLNVVWNSPSCSAQIQQVSQTTSGLYTLSTKKVGAVSIPVPPRDVQFELVDVYRTRLTQVQRLESAVATSRKRGFALRRSILKAAFEGRLTSTASAPSVEKLQEIA